MKIKSFKNLRLKINPYQILIFDLDNTIYDQNDYDFPAIKKVSIYLSRKINEKQNKIFEKLIKLKKKKNILIFNKFLKNYNLSDHYSSNLIKQSIKIFQNYRCKELNRSVSLYPLLKSIHKKKKIYLVTNGNNTRQNNKIKFLKIRKFFRKIYILDGIRKELKPSIKSVDYIQNLILKNGLKNAVFIGDNKSLDRNFAKNLKITFINFNFQKFHY